MLDLNKQKEFEKEVNLYTIFCKAIKGEDVFCPECGEKLVRHGFHIYCRNLRCEFDYKIN